MKVSIQSLDKRRFIGPSTTLAAVTASLLSLAGACGNTTSGANGTGAAPFMATPAAGSGVTATPGVAGTTARPAVAGAVAAPPTTAAAGSGTSAAPAAAGSGATAAATAGTAAAPSGGAATFAAVLEILADTKNNCGTCHKIAMVGGGLMFDPADKAGTWAALVGPTSKGTDGSSCGGKVYVVPGNPDGSLLYDKVSKDKPMCGLRMPASGVVLDPPEIATIKAWIMAGAPKD